MPTIKKSVSRPWIPKVKRVTQGGRTEKVELYNTRRWKRERLSFLQLNPLCAECSKQGRTTEAKVVDHIKPYRQGGDFWDRNNWQALCSSCHNSKSARERHGLKGGG